METAPKVKVGIEMFIDRSSINIDRSSVLSLKTDDLFYYKLFSGKFTALNHTYLN